MATGTELRTLTGHTAYVNAIAFSPSGNEVATASGASDRTVKLWESRPVKRATLQGHVSGDIDAVAYSPDGKTIASGGRDKTTIIWDVASGSARQTLTGHTDFVTSVAFSPDGKTLASGSKDRTVKLWVATADGTIPMPNASPTGTRPAPSPRATARRATFTAGVQRTRPTSDSSGVDASGTCQVTLPPGFTGMKGVWGDSTAILALSTQDVGGRDFATWTKAVGDSVINDPSLKGYQQVRLTQRSDLYLLEFTTDADPSSGVRGPARWIVAAKSGTATKGCVLVYGYPQDQAAKYGPIGDLLVASLRAEAP